MSIGLQPSKERQARASVSTDRTTTLFVVEGLGLSGKTKALVDLATGLDPARYRAEVAYFTDGDTVLAARLREHGIPLHEVSCPDRLDFSTSGRLAQLMRSVRPSVVHCYNLRAMLYGGLAARMCGVRGTVGTLSAFACQVPDRTYAFLPQALATASRRNRLRNRVACGLMRYVVAVAPSLGERFCRYNGVSRQKLRVVSYGANVEQVWQYGTDRVAAFRQQMGVDPDELLIGSVGRLVEQKDYPTQLRAFAEVARKAPRAKMAIAGDGPLRESLERQVADLGLRDRVLFLGHTDQVPIFLRSLDVFLLASKFEPLGIALLEAKAAGLPIVATRVNEIPDIVIHGQSGVLVPAETPGVMAEALLSLLEDRIRRGRLGQQALREAKEQHSLQAMLSSYEHLYDQARS